MGGDCKIFIPLAKHLHCSVFVVWLEERIYGVIIQKYVYPDYVEEWIKSPSKKCHNAPVVWKDNGSNGPPLIGNGLFGG